jgi:hypothetical protein
MKLKLTLGLIAVVGLLNFQNIYASDLLVIQSTITDKPYFGVGDIIYEATLQSQSAKDHLLSVKYRYVKITDDSITIRYEYGSEYDLSGLDKKIDEQTFVLALNEKDKAYLRVHELPRFPDEFKVVSTVLALTVYDTDRSLITVEELYKDKDYSDPQW